MRLETEFNRLYGPSLRTVMSICQCWNCADSDLDPASKLLLSVAAWLSDKSYGCDGRCASADEVTHCSGPDKVRVCVVGLKFAFFKIQDFVGFLCCRNFFGRYNIFGFNVW